MLLLLRMMGRWEEEEEEEEEEEKEGEDEKEHISRRHEIGRGNKKEENKAKKHG